MRRKISLAVVLIISISMLSFGSRIQKAKAATVAFTLHGSAGLPPPPPAGWSLTPNDETQPGPTLTAAVGDNVTLTLISDDGIEHQFLLDYNNNGIVDLEEPTSNLFLTNTTFSFIANLPGNFTYRCALHPTTMFGTFSIAVIPEYPTLLFLPLLLVGTFLVMVIFKRRYQ